MDNINKTINYIDMLKPNQLVEKVNLITDLNQQIDKEKSIYNNYLENIDNDKDNIILHKKYNKKTIDELQELFNNGNNINDMIKIYQTLCFKINDISNSLFNQVPD
jgi:hypothetical protein